MPGIADQYRTIAAAAGWRRAPERGYLQLGGRDRLQFLQALVTNDVGTLAPGQGAYAAWLTPQGRMITDLRLYARADRVTAGVPAAGAAALAQSLDHLIFSEDATVTDVSSRLTSISVIGGEASSILSRACAADAAALSSLAPWSHVDVENGFIARSDDARLPSYELCLDRDRQGETVARLEEAGAIPMSEELATALRIDAGRPLFGVDMDTDTIPLEAGLLDRAISTTKGCYVGQEVIIRVLHRGGGRVVRRLVRLAFDSAAPSQISPGATLRGPDGDAGRITSSAPAFDGNGVIALGYVRRELAESGGQLHLHDQLSETGTIAGAIVGLAG